MTTYDIPGRLRLKLKLPSGHIELTTHDRPGRRGRGRADRPMTAPASRPPRTFARSCASAAAGDHELVVESGGRRGGLAFWRDAALRFTIAVPHGSRRRGRDVPRPTSTHRAATARCARPRVSGDVTFGEVAGDATVKTVSGDVELGSVAGKAECKTVSGDVLLPRVGGDVNVNTVSGDVHVGEAAGSVQSKSVSGDLRLDSVRRGAAAADVGLRRHADRHGGQGVNLWMDVTLDQRRDGVRAGRVRRRRRAARSTCGSRRARPAATSG